jgi:nucleotide-binding universal stress UspA family protein
MSDTTSPFRSILVPVDGSRLAEQAIPTAIAIAQRTGASLRLALVHRELNPLLSLEPVDISTRTRLALEKADQEYMSELMQTLRPQLGEALTPALLKGPVAPTLTRYAKDIGTDLVVMTSHGRGGVRRAWLGSVADELVRTLELPIIILRPEEKRTAPQPVDLAKIGVPLDGSPLAETVLEPVLALARLWGSEVSLVQVVRPIVLTSDPQLPFPTGYADQQTRIRLSAVEDYLEAVADRLRAGGVKASGTALVGGAVTDTLLDFFQSEKAGLVAISTHGRGGVRRLVLGSVADKLVRAAEMPVLVLRPHTAARRPRMSRRRALEHSTNR